MGKDITQRALYRRWRLKILSLLGNKCARCGETDLRLLQVDHVRGGGTKERKKSSRGGSGTYFKRLFDEATRKPKKFQALCCNCNWLKRLENNES